MRSTIRTAAFVVLALLLTSADCDDCNGEDRAYDPVSLELNFQVCVDSSQFASRGLTISRYAGHLREAASAAAEGVESFEILPPVALSVRPESPAGRSWFRLSTRAEGLRAGEWLIDVDYIMGGVGENLDGSVMVLNHVGVYFTAGVDDPSIGAFPACP